MAEAAAPLPVAEASAVAAPAGRGRGRGKAKKGRGKMKKKAMKKAVPADGAEGEATPKKEPKLSLKAQVEQDIGDRDIEDVIKKARAKVDDLQKAVSKAQEDEMSFEASISNGKVKMAEASADVDKCVHEETLALEKLKAARRDLIEAQKSLSQKKMEAGDGDRALQVLESEGEMQKKTQDLIKQKQEVEAAKEAAKKALMEAQVKAKEVAQAMKDKRQALALTDDPEAAARAKAEAERAAEEDKARREAKTAGAHAEKDLKAQLKALDKMRADRDKERAKAFKEAAGLGSKKRALADGSAASPAKGAKIQDVD